MGTKLPDPALTWSVTSTTLWTLRQIIYDFIIAQNFYLVHTKIFEIPYGSDVTNLFQRDSLVPCTDYGRPMRKLCSLHGRKSNLNLKYLGTA